MDTSNDTQQSTFSAIGYANHDVLKEVVDEVQKMLCCVGPDAIVFGDYVISVLVPKYKKTEIIPFTSVDILFEKSVESSSNAESKFLKQMDKLLIPVNTQTQNYKQYILRKFTLGTFIDIALVNIHSCCVQNSLDFLTPLYVNGKFNKSTMGFVKFMEMHLSSNYIKALASADSLENDAKKFEKFKSAGWKFSTMIHGRVKIMNSWEDVMKCVKWFKDKLKRKKIAELQSHLSVINNDIQNYKKKLEIAETDKSAILKQIKLLQS